MDSSRYSHLAPAYDRLFPLDPDALSLVTDLARRRPGTAVVDAGCGTGLLVRTLADRGLRAHGFDLDEELLSRAFPRTGAGASFARGDLRSFMLPDDLGPVGLVTCLGNTLPHLLTVQEVRVFLERARDALSPGGSLLLQVLDYDRLRRLGCWELPVRLVDDLSFKRRYAARTDGLWTFHTQLAGPWGQSNASFELRPWGQSELEDLMDGAGFQREGCWGGFRGEAVGALLPLVLLARLL